MIQPNPSYPNQQYSNQQYPNQQLQQQQQPQLMQQQQQQNYPSNYSSYSVSPVSLNNNNPNPNANNNFQQAKAALLHVAKPSTMDVEEDNENDRSPIPLPEIPQSFPELEKLTDIQLERLLHDDIAIQVRNVLLVFPNFFLKMNFICTLFRKWRMVTVRWLTWRVCETKCEKPIPKRRAKMLFW
jgi:hypothetical protein